VRLFTPRVRRKAHPDHYPAPWRILDLWRDRATEKQEAQSLGELLVSRSSRNLVHVFLLGEELKRRGKTQAHGIEYVHVIGAGVMGADIAIWAAHKGFRVSLQDQKPEILARAMKKAYGFFKSKLKEPRAVQEAMDRFMPDLEGYGLGRADLVIEAMWRRSSPSAICSGCSSRRRAAGPARHQHLEHSAGRNWHGAERSIASGGTAFLQSGGANATGRNRARCAEL